MIDPEAVITALTQSAIRCLYGGKGGAMILINTPYAGTSVWEAAHDRLVDARNRLITTASLPNSSPL